MNVSHFTYYYDNHGRVIQERSTNHLGGYNSCYTAYNFTGQPVQTLSCYSTGDGKYTKEQYAYTYDHAGRLLTTTYTLNNHAPVTLNRFTYDELGRVSKKEVYGNRDNIRYQYNIRDQITQIKSTAFEENLYYTEIPAKWATHTSPMYNGNPAVQTWTHDNKINGYIYQYDTYNRYRGAYSILNNTWSDYYYTESFTYDLQGNIKTLDRWDNQDVMNYLFFTYNGNQVTKITDNGMQPFLYESKRYRDNNNTGNDFQYDANGNLTADGDRDIYVIKYNLLNLPDD